MGRPYAVKGKKKRKLEGGEASRAPPVDAEEVELEGKENEEVTEGEAAPEAFAEEVGDGIPIVPRPLDSKRRPGAIFVLLRGPASRSAKSASYIPYKTLLIKETTPRPKQKAPYFMSVLLILLTVSIGYANLEFDDHANYLRKQNRNPADYRPDIIHQALLAIFDSPLTKAGRLQAVYVRTEKGVLFEIALMFACHGRKPLLWFDVSLSYSAEKAVNLCDYVAKSNDDEPLVFVVGAMAHGKVDKEYSDDYIQISGYPLSAACCLNLICSALEQKWSIQ
ncbi:hypothetical protein ZWY2020_057370 [Hordeum vulgare]|nr:hypothetical protein ZWY2020_057370 [Hordeum vulgare]